VFRLNAFALPALVAALGSSPAIPTIPTFFPSGPPTTGIVSAADGTLYFVDSYHQTVWRVVPGRGREPFVTHKNGRALQIDPAGNLYGTHTDARGNLILWRADPQGTVTEIARPEVPDQFGHAFVIDDGEMIGFAGSGKRTGVRLWRAGEHDLQLLAGGELGLRDGAADAARFLPIGGLTRTAEGELLVTSGATIRRVSTTGHVSTLVQGEKLLRPRSGLIARLLGVSQGHLTGIAVAENGDIYVANAARDAVIRIDTQFRATEVWRSSNGWTPTGVVAAHGAVYVLEYGNGVRVTRIGADGVPILFALVPVNRAVASLQGSRALFES
jgi:hypothetical protein